MSQQTAKQQTALQKMDPNHTSKQQTEQKPEQKPE